MDTVTFHPEGGGGQSVTHGQKENKDKKLV